MDDRQIPTLTDLAEVLEAPSSTEPYRQALPIVQWLIKRPADRVGRHSVTALRRRRAAGAVGDHRHRGIDRGDGADTGGDSLYLRDLLG